MYDETISIWGGAVVERGGLYQAPLLATETRVVRFVGARHCCRVWLGGWGLAGVSPTDRATWRWMAVAHEEFVVVLRGTGTTRSCI
jgi:uncharacterized cupin superfamily protein